MSDNKDKFKNDMDEVTAMGLMQAEKVSVTKLSAMDYANRRKQWDAIETDLDNSSYKWYCTNTQIVSERLCQLPIYI